MEINELVREAYAIAVQHGWWDKRVEFGTSIALMHSELSEALEAERHGNPPSDHVGEISGVEEELADVIIRIADYCGGAGIDLERAIRLKMAFNATRPYKHGKGF